MFSSLGVLLYLMLSVKLKWCVAGEIKEEGFKPCTDRVATDQPMRLHSLTEVSLPNMNHLHTYYPKDKIYGF